MTRLLRVFVLFGVLGLWSIPSARADVKLPAMFSDHAVLQRDMPVPVWGWAEPGEEVTVSIAGQTHKATADDKGKWSVKLDAARRSASRSRSWSRARIGWNARTSSSARCGSAPASRTWNGPVASATNPDLEIPTANHPNIRVIDVKGPGSQTPVEDCNGKWEAVTPETVKEFSAVGYFFGRELQDHIGVPIGLIDNSWGGSACDAWIRRDKFEGNPILEPGCSSAGRRRNRNSTKPRRRPTMKRRSPTGRRRPTPPRAAGEPEPPGRPPTSTTRLTGNQRPANLYHARLGPVMPYAIRGVIWYQGESNAGRAYQYRELFPLMISSWREEWGQGDFPFYFVQLADFMAEKPEPGDSDWAELREAQTMTQDKLPNTGQAVIIDLGEAADIHPQEQARRGQAAGALALANDLREECGRREPAIRFDGKRRRQDRPEVQGRRRRTADGRQQQAGRIRDRRRGPQMGVGRREAARQGSRRSAQRQGAQSRRRALRLGR